MPLLFLGLSLLVSVLMWLFLSVLVWVAGALALMLAAIWIYYDSQRVQRAYPVLWKELHPGREISPFWMGFATLFLSVVSLPLFALELHRIRKLAGQASSFRKWESSLIS
jgi:FtsH-binding integral membrane protein